MRVRNMYPQKKAPAFSPGFFTCAHKEGRVFICRLFQRSYYDEYSSLENTIQWTFLLLSGSPLSFLFLSCTDCTVMSAFRSMLHSQVLSPDLQFAFLDFCSFRNLPLSFLPLLSDRCGNPKEDCSSLFPTLHLSGFRFQNLSGFYSSGESILQNCDLSKNPML